MTSPKICSILSLPLFSRLKIQYSRVASRQWTLHKCPHLQRAQIISQFVLTLYGSHLLLLCGTENISRIKYTVRIGITFLSFSKFSSQYSTWKSTITNNRQNFRVSHHRRANIQFAESIRTHKYTQHCSKNPFKNDKTGISTMEKKKELKKKIWGKKPCNNIPR